MPVLPSGRHSLGEILEQLGIEGFDGLDQVGDGGSWLAAKEPTNHMKSASALDLAAGDPGSIGVGIAAPFA